MQHESEGGGGPAPDARVAWQLVRILQDALLSLELTASRVLAAQVAGTITLWTQLHTFEDGPPAGLAWFALFLFIGGVATLGALLRPRRVTRFWDRALPAEIFTVARLVSPEEEAATVEHVATAVKAQRDALERALRISVPLGLAALTVTAVAFALEKAFYAP